MTKPAVDASTSLAEPKRYLETVPRRLVYWTLGALLIVVLAVYLIVPHYRPLKVASNAQLAVAHQQVIKQYFLASVNCKGSTAAQKIAQTKTFNTYFKVNQYANRATVRGCDNQDSLLAKDDSGMWQRTGVNIVLSSRQNPVWQKECLIDDITVADTKVRPENNSIDAGNLNICSHLQRQSDVEIHNGIHLHF